MAYANLVADGNTTAVTSRGDKVHVNITGTWGAGTAKLQFLDDQATPIWQDITGASWTTNADVIIPLGNDSYSLRINLAGATSPDLDITIK